MKIIAFCLAGMPFLAQAQPAARQSDSIGAKKYIHDLGISNGMDFRGSFNLSEKDWYGLMGSPDPDTSFKYAYSSNGTISGSNYTNIQAGFQLKPLSEEKRIDQVLRFSFGFGGSKIESAGWKRIDSYVIDTLTSSSTGSQYLVDSVVTYDFHKEYTVKEHQFAVQYVISTDRDKVVSGYVGIGVGMGVLRLPHITSYLSRSASVYIPQTYDAPYPPYGTTGQTYVITPQETIEKTVTGLGGSTVNANIQVPLGFDVRLSKKNNFMSRMVLGGEITYMCLFHKIPQADVYNVQQVRTGLHLRVRV